MFSDLSFVVVVAFDLLLPRRLSYFCAKAIVRSASQVFAEEWEPGALGGQELSAPHNSGTVQSDGRLCHR